MIPRYRRCIAGLAITLLTLTGCANTEETVEVEADVTIAEPVFRMIERDGVKLRVAEMGEGPLVILTHGWPELWYSWRYQMPALAEAGYHVVVPDMRGYGGSDAPEAVEDYKITEIADDIVGLIDYFGEEKATLVGHDWGAIIAWNTVLLHEDRFNGVMAMSVPYNGRGPVSPIAAMEKGYGDNFFYILYFQEPGVAEAEFDPQPYEVFKRLYADPDTPRDAPELTDPKASAGGWLPRMGRPTQLPDWLSEEDLAYYTQAYENSGFRGGFSYYRNFQRNWEITPELTGAKIGIPAFFLAGEKDSVIRGASKEALTASLSRSVTDLRGVRLIEGGGHWIQQQEADIVNEELLAFLAEVHGK